MANTTSKAMKVRINASDTPSIRQFTGIVVAMVSGGPVSVSPRVAVNSLSTASWTLEQDLELYAELGVHTAAWYLAKLDDAGVERIKASGIVAHHVFTNVTPENVSRALDYAVELGAPRIAITTGPAEGKTWDDAALALDRLLAPFRDRGPRIAVEQTLPVRVEIGFVHSLRDSIELAERLDLDVVVEANYCFNERDLDETLQRAGARIGTVQVNDLIPPSNVIPDRAVPGDGVIPLEHLVASTTAAGYAGPYEIEQLGPRIEAEGYAAALRRAIDQMNRIAEMSPANTQ